MKNNVMTEQYGSHSTLDVSGIPSADDYERKCTEAADAKTRSDAERARDLAERDAIRAWLQRDGERVLPLP